VTARHGVLLALLAAIWGGSYLLIKYGLEGFAPAEIVFLRTALAAAVLIATIHWQGGEALRALRAARRRPGLALLLGTTAIIAPFLLITFGEKAVPSGLTAVLIAPASLFVALFAPVLDRSERIDRRQAGGLVAGLAGVALLVGVETVSTVEEFLGALGIIAASACYALAGFVVKRGYAGTPAIVSSAISCTVAAIATLPVGVATAEHSAPGLRAVLAVAALGVVGTAIAFVIFYKLIGEIGAGRASLVSYLAPGVALFYGAALLDEHVGWAAIVGLALILSGVAVAARRRAVTPEPACEPVPDAV
jgi:drug/metabolite transporter (DMT)-like permease